MKGSNPGNNLNQIKNIDKNQEYLIGNSDKLNPNIDSTFNISPSITSSPRFDRVCTFRLQSSSPVSSSIPVDPPHDFISMKRLFEDKCNIIKTRNFALINENNSLKEQLNEESNKNQELKKQLSLLEKKYSIEIKNNGEVNSNNVKNSIDDWRHSICKSCRRNFLRCEPNEPIIFVTKTELNNLENKVQILRESLKAKENFWQEIVDREENYSQQLTNSVQELLVVKQLAENHYSNLESTTKILEERERQLKAIEKNSIVLKSFLETNESTFREGKNVIGIGKISVERIRRSIEKILRQIPSERNTGISKRRQESTSPRSNRSTGGDAMSPRS